MWLFLPIYTMCVLIKRFYRTTYSLFAAPDAQTTLNFSPVWPYKGSTDIYSEQRDLKAVDRTIGPLARRLHSRAKVKCICLNAVPRLGKCFKRLGTRLLYFSRTDDISQTQSLLVYWRDCNLFASVDSGSFFQCKFPANLAWQLAPLLPTSEWGSLNDQF